MKRPRILVVDDEEGMREVCSDTLEQLGDVEVVTEGDPLRAKTLLDEQSFDLMVTDIRMPGLSGVELLRHARERDPDLPVLMLTGFPSVETAVESMKLGAVDYVTKPFLPDELVANARRFLEARRLKEENELLRRQQRRGRFDELVGESEPMQRVFDVIERISGTDVDVLVRGETGTGKELVARALHQRSQRKDKRFVPVDCGAIPENLLESEFFGYERGAFTGANSRSIGLLEFADEGTLFLDELGELPILLQAKLLRTLQERKIRRLGGKQEISVDVRVVAATAQDLEKAVKEGTFRQDLYFRVDVVQIHLPPLRERGDDVRLLAQHFVERHAREMGKDVKGFTPEAMEVLLHYRWPGNVRELQNVVRRGLAMTRDDEIGVDVLPDRLVTTSGDRPRGGSRKGLGFFEQRAQRVAAFEREFLASLLRSHKGDVASAAKEAQVPRGTYYRLMKNHGLKASDFRTG
ncbi:MAG: sigma-54-dependent Fis family transcriptional regulator [Planctomycetota bacterium]|nr:MAG: sigma-54-dependent Fis family transcriptional regulator [Planctomycetota bacterium]